MLKELKINDFAIIYNVDVSFSSGMTAITGETGAGKSLLIDTLSLLCGDRADNDMIRFGAPKATILGIFDTNDIINDLLSKEGIKIEKELSIYREIKNNGNIIKINNCNTTLQTLKNISSHLISIHNQNDTMKLFSKDNYLSFIDPKNDNKFDDLYMKYLKDLSKYNESLKIYNQILKGKEETLKEKDFYEYAYNEIKELNLYEDIDIDLNDRISKLSNFDKIKINLSEALNNLDGEISSIDNIYLSSKSLENIEQYDNKYYESKDKILDAYYNLLDIKDFIYKELNNLDYDEDELNNSQELLDNINKLKNKYKKDVKELIQYQNELELKLKMSLNYDDVLKEKEDELKNNFDSLLKSSSNLSNYRKKIAKDIEKGIILEAKDLDLTEIDFEIKFINNEPKDIFDNNIFTPQGIDIIDFYVSFNKGEPKLPLSKVISGGEASRMMLAFKSYFVDKEDINVMIFDEIDTGVSGSTARKIGEKIKDISTKCQVILITHLAQVAAIADYEKKISKSLNDGRTMTSINDLNYDERVEEIAKMLSGDKISLYAIEHAKELLNN